MSFTPKAWENEPSHATPVNADALVDLETRVTNYADSIFPSTNLTFKGTWNASTNTPTLADGSGAAGDFYRVSASGTQNLGSGSVAYAVGDTIVYSGTVWQLVSGSAAFVLLTDFGVLGDGSDETTAIQAAFDWVRTNGGTLYVPKPAVSFTHSATLDLGYATSDGLLNRPLRVIGVARGRGSTDMGSIFHFTGGPGDGPQIRCTNWNNSELAHCHFSYDHTTGFDGDQIDIESVTHATDPIGWHVHHCSFRNTDSVDTNVTRTARSNIRLAKLITGQVDHCGFSDAMNAIRFHDGSSNYANVITIGPGNNFSDCSDTHHIMMGSPDCEDLTIRENNFEVEGAVRGGVGLGTTNKGNWDGQANSPALVDGTGTLNDYYVITVGAVRNLGSGTYRAFPLGGRIRYDGANWVVSENRNNQLYTPKIANNWHGDGSPNTWYQELRTVNTQYPGLFQGNVMASSSLVAAWAWPTSTTGSKWVFVGNTFGANASVFGDFHTNSKIVLFGNSASGGPTSTFTTPPATGSITAVGNDLPGLAPSIANSLTLGAGDSIDSAATGALQLGRADHSVITAVTSMEAIYSSTLSPNPLVVQGDEVRIYAHGNERFRANNTGFAFEGQSAVARPTYTVTNPTTDRGLNVTADTTAQVAQVLGTLIADLQTRGLLQ